MILVSALITNINYNIGRSIDKYIEYGKYLLSNTFDYKIIFIERDILFEHFAIPQDVKHNNKFIYESKEFDYIINNNTIFVLFEKTDNYLYNYKNSISNFEINTDNPNKDTIEYMFVQCHKTEWLKMAICLIEYTRKEQDINVNLNSTLNTQFIWIDFGIYHMFNNLELFNNTLQTFYIKNLTTRGNNNKFRIASCIDPNNRYHTTDIYKNVVWYFAGSVFGGSSNSITQFASIMKEKCLQIIRERKHLMWEVNIWYLIYLEHPELFDIYMCNHNPSILANY